VKKISIRTNLHLLFIDLTKAYDDIPFQMIWVTLENISINNTIINAIQQLYNDSIIKIKSEEYVPKRLL
jgi:hypothetical protein